MSRMVLVVFIGLMGTMMCDFVAWHGGGSTMASGLRRVRTGRQQSPRQSEWPKQLQQRTVEDARSELEAIFQELSKLSKHLPKEELKQLADMRRNWDGELRVLLVGDFSSGKSTLMNVLVGKAVAKTGPKPTTKSLTDHSCGKYQNILLVDTPGINSDEGEEQLGKPAKYIISLYKFSLIISLITYTHSLKYLYTLMSCTLCVFFVQ